MKKLWWNVRDTALDKLEELLNYFWWELKNSWSLDKAIILCVVILLCVGAILSNLGGEKKEGSSSNQTKMEPIESTDEPSSNDVIKDSFIEGVDFDGDQKMKKVGLSFVKEYTTYEDWGFSDRSNRIRPFVTDEMYNAEKEASEDVPKGEIPESVRFSSVEDVEINALVVGGKKQRDRPTQIIWSGTVSSVQKEDGEFREIREEIQLILIPVRGEWKVAEVVYL